MKKNKSANLSPGFWHWFLGGARINGVPGWTKICYNKWFFVHIIIGTGLTELLHTSEPYIIKGTILAVLGFILLLLPNPNFFLLDSFNNQSISKFFSKHPDGHNNYIYIYQMSILILITSAVYWLIFLLYPNLSRNFEYIGYCLGFSLFSLSLRELWSMTLMRSYIVSIAFNPNMDDTNDKKPRDENNLA